MKSTQIIVGLIVICMLWLFTEVQLQAKPVGPFTLEDAASIGDLIVVASYQSHEEPKAGTAPGDLYMGGLLSHFKVEQVLRPIKKSQDKDVPKDLKLNYCFHDWSPCMPDQSFKFSEDKMPKKGSKWILFLMPLENPETKVFRTYRGDRGMLPATDDNLKKVKALVNTPHGL